LVEVFAGPGIDPVAGQAKGDAPGGAWGRRAEVPGLSGPCCGGTPLELPGDPFQAEQPHLGRRRLVGFRKDPGEGGPPDGRWGRGGTLGQGQLDLAHPQGIGTAQRVYDLSEPRPPAEVELACDRTVEIDPQRSRIPGVGKLERQRDPVGPPGFDGVGGAHRLPAAAGGIHPESHWLGG
jgi:hypothetical protein